MTYRRIYMTLLNKVLTFLAIHDIKEGSRTIKGRLFLKEISLRIVSSA